jgi:hypothetical protein
MSCPCNDGCGKIMPRRGDRCPECVAAFNAKVEAALLELGPVAGYMLQISYHIGPNSFATLYAKVPGASLEEAMQRASKARQQLDYHGQAGIIGHDIKLGSIYYQKELERAGC